MITDAAHAKRRTKEFSSTREARELADILSTIEVQSEKSDSTLLIVGKLCQNNKDALQEKGFKVRWFMGDIRNSQSYCYISW